MAFPLGSLKLGLRETKLLIAMKLFPLPTPLVAFSNPVDSNLIPLVNLAVVLGFSLFVTAHTQSIGKLLNYIQNRSISYQSPVTILILAIIISYLGYWKSLWNDLSSTLLFSCRLFSTQRQNDPVKMQVHSLDSFSQNPISLRGRKVIWPLLSLSIFSPYSPNYVNPLKHTGHLTGPQTRSVFTPPITGLAWNAVPPDMLWVETLDSFNNSFIRLLVYCVFPLTPSEIQWRQRSLFTYVSRACKTLPGIQHVFNKYVLNKWMKGGSSEVIMYAKICPSASLLLFRFLSIFLKCSWKLHNH